MKTVFGICCAASNYGASTYPEQRRWSTKLLFRKPHSACQHLSFNCVSICVLAPLVHWLARNILRYQKSLKEVFFLVGGAVWECSKTFPYRLMITASLLHKGFRRAPCFRTAGETCNTLELIQEIYFVL